MNKVFELLYLIRRIGRKIELIVICNVMFSIKAFYFNAFIFLFLCDKENIQKRKMKRKKENE